jgi:hypothetical protein
MNAKESLLLAVLLFSAMLVGLSCVSEGGGNPADQSQTFSGFTLESNSPLFEVRDRDTDAPPGAGRQR